MLRTAISDLKNGEKNSINCYDLKEKRYIFDEMTLEDEAYVKTRLTTGEYWIQKDEAVWLYDLSKDSWRKVEEIT